MKRTIWLERNTDGTWPDLNGIVPDMYQESTLRIVYEDMSCVPSKFKEDIKTCVMHETPARIVWLSLSCNAPEWRDLLRKPGEEPKLYEPSVHIPVAAVVPEDGLLHWKIYSRRDPVLKHSSFYIPLLDVYVRSLNSAATLLSEEFEVDRESHTINIYDRSIVESELGSQPLQEIRKQLIHTFGH